MGDRDRLRPPHPLAALAALAAVAAFALAAAVVIWWLLLREEPRPPEPPPIEIEAEGPEDEAIVVPAPGAPELGVVRVGIGSMETRVAARLDEELPTAPLEGPLRVSMRDVTWNDPEGRPFFVADSIGAVLDGGALNEGNVLVAEATLVDPALFLARATPGAPWNYERVLTRVGVADAEPPGPNGAPLPDRIVRLRDVAIRNGLVVVRPPGAEAYRFADIDAFVSTAALAVPREPPRIVVERLEMTAVVPGPAEPLAVAARDAEIGLPAERVTFDVARLGVDGSVATEVVAAYVPEAPGLGLEAVARVERLEFEDIRFLSPELPPEGIAEFGLEVEPLPGARTSLRLADLVAALDASRVVGAVDLAIGPEAGVDIVAVDLRLEPVTIATLERFVGPLPYAGELRGTVRGAAGRFAFDVTGVLTTPGVAEPITAGLAGTLTLAEDRFALQALEVDLRDVPLEALRPLAPGLPLAGRVTGRVVLRGPPGRAPLELDVRLTFAEGTALVSGTLDLTGPVPAYDLSGRLIGVSLPALLEPEVPPVAITARFTLVGQGLDPTTARARLALRGGFTGWEAGPGDTVLVRAAVADGALALDAAALSLATLSFAAEGSWRFLAPARGALAYRLAFTDVEPFAPYLPFLADAEARGAVSTVGTLSGPLDRPRLAGELEGAALEYGEWAAEALEATYDIVLEQPLPRARVTAAATNLETPGDGVYEVATAAFLLEEPRFAIEIEAGRVDGGVFELSADGRVEEDRAVRALVRRLNLDLDEQRWVLERTALLDWAPEEGVAVRGFVLRQVDGEGVVAIDGRVPPTATAGLSVEIAALPVGQVLELLGREPVVTGDLWVEARAVGPPASPRVRASFRLEEGGVGTMYATRFEGAVLYEDLRLVAEATAVLDTLGRVELTASLPVALELTAVPSARLLERRPLRASLRADSLPLSAVTMLTREIEDAEGVLRADVRLSGTPDAPRLDGVVQVWNGAVTILALDQRYEEISADIVLEDRLAVVRDLRARSDGWAVASGTIAFPSLTTPVLDLVVEFDEFRAIGVQDLEDAAARGELRITGQLPTPVVSGDVTLDDGNVVVPSFGDDGLDAELEDFAESPLDPLAELDAAEPVPWFERVTLDDLILEAGDDLWFVTEQARVQLGGELVLAKAAGEPLGIFGELEGERGTFTLRVGPLVRRFDIESAEIRFFGTRPPNPALSIVATRIVPSATGQPVEIRLVIGGTVEAPTVAVRTAEGANVPESELLSFLLFGQPSFALADGAPVEPFLEEAIFGVGSLAEVVSIELEETLIADIGLPLDYFQIRPTPGPLAGFGAPTLAFGRELADDVFLTVNAALAGAFGAAAGPATWTAIIHWRIDPEWSLELGIAPVYSGRLYPGFGTALPVSNPEQQFIIELLRRWTY